MLRNDWVTLTGTNELFFDYPRSGAYWMVGSQFRIFGSVEWKKKRKQKNKIKKRAAPC